MGLLVRFAVMVAVTTVIPISAAHAYLDAASASLAVQALVGTVAAYILTGKIYFRKLKGLFARKRNSDVESSDVSD
ncbi:hypothetical protein GCM10011494_03100 [Novosphingobium endophyticum]|uniref:Uncharacterized protein n=1 Tax=Novosphingobium endophyticum TaxID=1955250 RepID=A0A916X323_9SPHN|nr:hypothetical protein [Novosphingobium endophyticum]GGB88191.1 hypothetical protein GCM10011494_03100 [Novosphingobium endophyticum]